MRAIAKALDTDWETAFAMIANAAYQMNDMMHSNSVWGAVLRQHNFYRKALPDSCPDCYTAEDFARDHPKGTYVLCGTNHVLTVQNGRIFDSWDSSGMTPQYYWTKGSDQM